MRHRIAVIPGDGIGNEVVPEGQRVLEAAAPLAVDGALFAQSGDSMGGGSASSSPGASSTGAASASRRPGA